MQYNLVIYTQNMPSMRQQPCSVRQRQPRARFTWFYCNRRPSESRQPWSTVPYHDTTIGYLRLFLVLDDASFW